MPAEATAIPPNPNKAAIKEKMKNVSAQLNIKNPLKRISRYLHTG